MKKIIAILAFLATAVPSFHTYAQSDDETIVYRDDVNSIKLSKVVEKSEGNEYMITLSSFVTGTKETHEEEVRTPVDFTLVLDTSLSMLKEINQTDIFEKNVKLSYNSRIESYKTTAGTRENVYVDCDELPREEPYDNLYSNYSPYYYLHTDGKYYRLKGHEYQKGSQTIYCIYFDTDENVYDPVQKKSIKKRFFIGRNSSGEYDASHFANRDKPVVFIEGGNSTNDGSYSEASGYYSTDPDTTLYDGSLFVRSRKAALTESVDAFIQKILEDDATKLNDETGHHRIGIVKFGSEEDDTIGNTLSASQIVKDFENVGDLEFSLNSLICASATRTDQGLGYAKKLYDSKSDSEKERRNIVVLFTDGNAQAAAPRPTDVFVPPTRQEIEEDAIKIANELKEAGSEIYVIGMIDAPDEECIKFLSYTSSDYPDAEDLNGTWSKSFDKYLHFVTTGEEMNSVFETIATISSKTEIGINLRESGQVVFDALTKHFLLPDDVTETDTHRIGVYTRDFLGIVNNVYTFDEKLKSLPEAHVSLGGEHNREIIVSGFDFAENWCGRWISINRFNVRTEVWQGKELVIKIPIVIDPANPGGANMNTNEPTSGIYPQKEDGTPDFSNPLMPFPLPEVSLPNIVIVKNGMKENNSAIFNITRLNADGTEDSTYKTISIMTIADGTGIAKARVKLVGEGRYKVSEQSWSWAYDSVPTANYDKDDGYTTVEGNSITRNVVKATIDSTENGTVYTFTNIERKKLPAHGEDAINNVFYTPQIIIQ